MKFLILILTTILSSSVAFVPQMNIVTSTKIHDATFDSSLTEHQATRQGFIQDVVKVTSATIVSSLVITTTGPSDVAHARGRATLEVSYRKFTPRIIAGGEFYSKDMKQYVASANFEAIQNALREPPSRVKDDLRKVDSGVAERARLAGQFSDARVLTAADLFASAFSESSISSKTKKMQASVAKLRSVVEEMETICKQALGQEQSGGLFGIGAKKVDKNELAKRLRQLYVDGGNAYNEYVLTANTDLALQFDKLPYIK
jgi:molybdenum-dependent DNA-binding transcriptional regulator ModE